MASRRRSRKRPPLNQILAFRPVFRIRLGLPSFETVITACVALAIMGLAIHELGLTARYSDLMFLAERIEREQAVSAASVKQLSGYVEDTLDQGICRRDIVLAGATVALRRVDNGNPVDGYEEWWRSLIRARDYIAFALSCTPTDSNLWLRYAILDSLIAEEPQKVARLMAMAVKLSPADQSDLLARLYFWNRLSAESLKAAEADVQIDLRRVYGRVLPWLIPPVVPSISAALKPYAAAAVMPLSQDRKNMLVWGKINLKELLN